MKFILSIAILIIFNIRSDIACTAEFNVRPEITVKEEYSDNINFVAGDDAKEDFITHVDPKIEATCENEKNRLHFIVSGYFKKYLDDDDMDTFDGLYDINSSLSYAYTNSDTSNNSLTAVFDKNSDPQEELEESGEDMSTDANDIYERIKKSFIYSASRIVSDKNLLGSDIFYERTDYKSDAYLDTDIYGLNIEFGRMISNRMVLYVIAGGAYGEGSFDNWFRRDNLSFKGLSGIDVQGMTGFLCDIFPSWSMDTRLGMRRLDISFEPNLQDFDGMADGGLVGIVTKETGYAPVGYIELKRTGERSEVSIKYDVDLTTSGRSLFVDKKTAKVTCRYRFSEFFSTEINGKIIDASAFSKYFPTDTEKFSVFILFNYMIRENLNLSFSLSHSKLKNHEEDTEAEKNTVYIDFTWSGSKDTN